MKTSTGMARAQLRELFKSRRVMAADRKNRNNPLGIRVAALNAQYECDQRIKCELAAGARHRVSCEEVRSA